MTQEEALTILKTGANAYLTGEPGAGKSYTIRQYVSYLRDHEIEPAITASTGIAATHIGGLTIHSWSGIGIAKNLSPYDIDRITSNEYVLKRINKTKVLIIDEISMLPSDTLNSIDQICREVRRTNEPFGGMQVILVGDFFQLPPITREAEKAKFAFDSDAWVALNPIVCYLNEQHRQEDPDFLEVLSAMRTSSIERKHLDFLEERVMDLEGIPGAIPKLFPHNADVDRLNDQALGQIDEETAVFEMTARGKDNLVAALVRGCLSPEKLVLKRGASVMFTKNNQGAGYANGTLGTVIDFDEYSHNPVIKTRDGMTITVEPASWAVEEDGKVRAEITQIPLRLAWAMTIHKSQGMSLDAVAMDLTRAFEFGQGYVALSRVRTLAGLYLLGYSENALQVHPEISVKDAELHTLSDSARKAFNSLTLDELSEMHNNFILASGGKLGVIKKKPKPKMVSGNTRLETLTQFKAGKSTEEIAEARGITEETVFGHLEKLLELKLLTREEIWQQIPEESRDAIPVIHAAFAKLETDKLTPVREHLKNKYSFPEIRLARMLIEK
jgi:ATP-dependent DNA helicase PIF1